MVCMLGQIILFLISNNNKRLSKFRLHFRIICQHEYNSFGHLRFPRVEGAKKNMNNKMLTNLGICNSNKNLTQKSMFPRTKYFRKNMHSFSRMDKKVRDFVLENNFPSKLCKLYSKTSKAASVDTLD